MGINPINQNLSLYTTRAKRQCCTHNIMEMMVIQCLLCIVCINTHWWVRWAILLSFRMWGTYNCCWRRGKERGRFVRYFMLFSPLLRIRLDFPSIYLHRIAIYFLEKYDIFVGKYFSRIFSSFSFVCIVYLQYFKHSFRTFFYFRHHRSRAVFLVPSATVFFLAGLNIHKHTEAQHTQYEHRIAANVWISEHLDDTHNTKNKQMTTTR